MNSFFARSEQTLNPEWIGKPLIVAPYTGPTGCCIAVSTEGKQLGIKTGMSVKEALFRYPRVIIAESRPTEYRKIHKQIIKTVSSFTPWLSILSIDEMALPLSPSEQTDEHALLLAKKIKRAFLQTLGPVLTASIGIGPNVYLAKQAAEITKPDGLHILHLNDIPSWLKTRELTDLTGIAHRGARRLAQVGITKPIDLYETPPAMLRKKLGIAGDYWHLKLHGYPVDYIHNPTKSVGHSCVLPPEARNWSAAYTVMQKLIERATVRLRQKKLIAEEIHVSIRYLHRPSWHASLITPPFRDSKTFLDAATILWQQAPRNGQPLLIAVTAYRLSHQPHTQHSLFSTYSKLESLYTSLDTVNEKFGKWTLKPASLLVANDYAPSRIAFGRAGIQE